MSLLDRITVKTDYTRSINLERDSAKANASHAYVPTARAEQTLGRIAETLHDGSAPRAWALVGPYGSGKSAFGLFLTELLGSLESLATAHAYKTLKSSNPEIARRLVKLRAEKSGHCVVVLTGSPEPMGRRLIQALSNAANRYWGGRRGRSSAVVGRLQEAATEAELPTSRMLELITELQDALARAGASGLLIVIDELGKFLEYEARHRNGSDIYLLQAIAERAMQAHPAPLHFLVLMHQAFELYAQGFGEQLRNEWKKVQGRFEAIPFVESTEQILRVVRAAFSVHLDKRTAARVNADATAIAGQLAALGALPGGLHKQAAAALFAGCFPLHPLSLLLLPGLCQKVAQNERTLFSYLGSSEPHGLLYSLAIREHASDELPWIRPWEIYEYFILNQPGLVTDPLTHRRWAEIVTAVERLGDAASHEIDLLKTIGLFNIVGAQGGLKASSEILRICAPVRSGAHATLAALSKKSIITYRKFSGEYRVWQGSDFDLDAARLSQMEQIASLPIAQLLNDRRVLPPIVARRYAIRMGTLRYFTVRFVDATCIDAVQPTDRPTIYYCLAENSEEESAFEQAFARLTVGPTLGAIIPSGRWIRGAVACVIALERVQRSSPELIGDPVAQRELRDTLNAARRQEHEALAAIVEEPEVLKWVWNGTRRSIGDKRELQQALSVLLETVFPGTPLLRSELINRERPSSSAVAGRKKLLAAMLTDGDKADLGIDKFPAEKGMYRALLHATGLHQRCGTGWSFGPPQHIQGTETRILPVWAAIDGFLDSSDTAPKPIADMFAQLKAAPYGLKAGVLPVLFLAACQAYQDEMALYEGGYYVPFMSLELLERIMKEPSNFSVQRVRIDTIRQSLFRHYATAVSGETADSPSLLAVIKPLARFMVNLPDFTRRTKTISTEAQSVRELFFAAKSPAQMLFEDLPAACGFGRMAVPGSDPQVLEAFAKKFSSVLVELRVAYHGLLHEIQRMIKTAFGMDKNLVLHDIRDRLRGRYKGLEEYTIDVQGLRAFVGRLTDPYGEEVPWLISVASFLARKPPEKWADEDTRAAEYRLVEFATRLRDLEQLRLVYDSRKAERRDVFEVMLLRVVRQGMGEFEAPVYLDAARQQAVQQTLVELRTILCRLSEEELRLAALALLTSEILPARVERDATQTRAPQAGGR